MRWTGQQIEFIEKNYGKIPLKELTQILGKSESSIKTYCYRNGLKARAYSGEEDELIEKEFGKRSTEDIAKKIGRSPKSVRRRVDRLDLGTQIDNINGLHIAEVSRLTGVPESNIRRWKMVTHKAGRYRYCSENQLIDFLKNNPQKYKATECEYYYFSRFDWFREKYRREISR